MLLLLQTVGSCSPPVAAAVGGLGEASEGNLQTLTAPRETRAGRDDRAARYLWAACAPQPLTAAARALGRRRAPDLEVSLR